MPDQRKPREPKVKLVDRTCENCGAAFIGEPSWRACPKLVCQSKIYWTADEWDGAARMADVRAQLAKRKVRAMTVVTGFEVREVSPSTALTTRTMTMGPMELTEIDKLSIKKRRNNARRKTV